MNAITTGRKRDERATILIVDDEISNIEIMNEALGDNYEICFATSGEQALALVHQTMPDLVLLDVVMPGIQGFEVCQRLKADPVLADIPVIFTTGLGDTADEVRGLSLGAIDYVTKPIEPVILRNRVKNHVELKRLRDHLAEMAVTDALTGLHNRRKLDGLLKQAVDSLSSKQDWLSILMLDIDFFKQFNDAYGHPSGDRCISMVAAALNRAVASASGYSARYGGEEFACVLPSADIERAREVAFEIRNQVQQLRIPHESSSVSPFVTISIGIATARSQPGLEPQVWTQTADEQLYQAKSAGRDQIRARDFTPEIAATA
jgi:diguanylate cyclase (GGDEF)-like protein